MIILVHHFVEILLAKILIWAPFSQSMCAFSFCINPCKVFQKMVALKLYIYILIKYLYTYIYINIYIYIYIYIYIHIYIYIYI